MQARFKKQEEKWVPISEWGRSFAQYLEGKNIVLVVKQEKPARPSAKRKKPQHKAIKPAKAFASCACGKRLWGGNASGQCKACQDAPIARSTCNQEGCTSKLNRQNKSGFCDRHSHTARQLAYLARKAAA